MPLLNEWADPITTSCEAGMTSSYGAFIGDVAASSGASDRARSAECVRVRFLGQENLPDPPHVPGGSIARSVYELTHRVDAGYSDRSDVTVCSRPHRDLPEGTHDGVRYMPLASATTVDAMPTLAS